ncbi:Isonitrile hydratase [Ferriphaselus amnicola]|uniref:Isonitrile hydratase n=1 Tax=Ferriphaselus amnicola TaxID=1188319 RepID=A0A2Z6GC23_9PROT|nr:DJ-1 family glyoxalase III [Ferriphaselus amnicola]BBE51113.1 Isonitrile hydratase [Ferriphaselus amnicola]
MSRVLVPLAAGFEDLEAVTVTDLLRRAGLTVVIAGLDGQIQRGSRGVMLQPDTTLEAALTHEFDMLVLPGGQPGTNNLKADARIIGLVKKMVAEGKYVTAICAAPSVLAAAGVLDGKRATSFPGALDAYPEVQQQRAAIVEDGKLITSRGPGTAMDFALTLIERLVSKATRDEVEAGLQR